MNKFRLTFHLLAFAIFMLAFTSTAQAQATRTWVSGVGDDANPCSRTAPCKTFAGAISKTAASGEINCLDPGGFGAVTITKSISIICDVGTAGVLVSGTNGIIINALATDMVNLEGLDIDGLGTGLNGVQILGGRVTIRRTTIRRFSGNGVNLVGTAGSRVYIIDSLIMKNAGGVNVKGASGAANFGTLVDTVVDSNTSFAVQVTDPVNEITLSTSTLTGSGTSISKVTGGIVTSIGPSNFISGAGLPTSTIAFK